jgi:ABC-type sulfate/molybdate transport systems ATPase subunit
VTSRWSEEGLAPVRARIGFLFQNYALFDFMTVADNVAFPLAAAAGASPAADEIDRAGARAAARRSASARQRGQAAVASCRAA